MNVIVTPNQNKDSASETLEQKRHNYSVQAHMEESDDTSRAGVAIKSNKQAEFSTTEQKKNKTSLNDILFINDVTNALINFELMMAKKYGEDFDLHLAAEFLNEETYKKLASIKDMDERRDAVAAAIKEGIENGTIDPKAVEDFNPDFGDWVEQRDDYRQAMTLQRELELKQDLENQMNVSQDTSLEQNAMAAFTLSPS